MRIVSRRMLLGALCALPLAFGLSVQADDAPDAKPVTLVRTFKKGDTYRMKTTIKVEIGGMEINISQTSKSVYKDSKKEGEHEFEQVGEGGTINIGGQEQEMPASPPVKTVITKLNRIVSYKIDGGDQGFFTPATQQLLAYSTNVFFPDKPVKAKDTWTIELDNPASKEKKVAIKGTYLGTDKVDTIEAWKIKQTMEATTEDGNKMTAEITAWIDPATGEELKAEVKADGIPTQMGTIGWTGKTERLKPEKKEEKKEEKKGN